MRPKTLRTLALAGVLALGAAACAAPEEDSSGGNTGNTGAAGASGDTGGGSSSGDIVIGVDIEMSGPAAVQGTAYKNAVELVRDQINDAGGVNGRQIKLVIQDNKSDPTESLQVAKNMITNDHVVAIVGGGSSPTTLSLADTVESEKVPTVSMGSSGAIVNPVAKRQYLFKTPANTGVVIERMLQDFKKRGVNTVGLLTVDNPYGAAGLAGFQQVAKEGKVKLVGTEKFQDTDKDFTAQITKLVAKKPDAIVTWAIPPGAGIAAKNIKSSGFQGKAYFDAGAGAELFIKGAGQAAEGIYMVHPTVLVADDAPSSAPNAKEMKDFYQAYTEKYGEYSGFASYAADALHLIVNAIDKADSTDPAKVRDALEHTTYNGITGVFHMTAKDHSGLRADALSVLTVKDGTWALAD